jgi:hypothetical protein
MSAGQEALRPRIDDLVEVGRTAGRARTTRRTIRYWTSGGLVDRPRRVGRAYVYPIVSLGQVDSLARWDRRKIDDDMSCFARFIEANAVDPDTALRVAAIVLESLGQELSTARTEIARDPGALRHEAAVAARMRGQRAPFPRRVRMTSDQRTAAFMYMAGQMIPDLLSTDEAAHGRAQLERLLGQRSGRGGADRDLTNAMPALSNCEPDRLIQALSTATRREAEFARAVVELACLWFPALIPMIASTAPSQQVPFLDIALAWAANLTPDFYVVIFATLLAQLVDKRSTQDGTEGVASFDLAHGVVEILAGRSEAEILNIAMRLRPLQRARLASALGHDGSRWRVPEIVGGRSFSAPAPA